MRRIALKNEESQPLSDAPCVILAMRFAFSLSVDWFRLNDTALGLPLGVHFLHGNSLRCDAPLIAVLSTLLTRE